MSTLPADSSATSYGERPAFKEEKALREIYARATQDDPQSVLKIFDWFVEEEEPMMNVGKTKGDLLKSEVLRVKPKVAVEIGSYCGYSAVVIGSNLPADGHLYSFELDPLHAAISTKVVEYAGLKDKVTVIVGTVQNKLPDLKSRYGVTSIDLAFIDHAKGAYVKDFKLLEEGGFFHKGSTILADNILMPGAPEYHKYLQELPTFSSRLEEFKLKYGKEDYVDAVEVSIKL